MANRYPNFISGENVLILGCSLAISPVNTVSEWAELAGGAVVRGAVDAFDFINMWKLDADPANEVRRAGMLYGAIFAQAHMHGVSMQSMCEYYNLADYIRNNPHLDPISDEDWEVIRRG